jgi:Protein of unknown function (DUF1588)/Protein of unknown function (DUF1592)/Protein of unknown function (DUF1595)/Protein of unknown function (DUF1585)/Protein of unknown function (DUF1587)
MKVIGGVSRSLPRLGVVALVGLGGLACGGVSGRGAHEGDEEGSGQSGGSAGVSGGATSGAGTVAGGGAGPLVDIDSARTTFRILTQAEYRSAVTDLLGAMRTPLQLPSDTSVSGFVSVGAAVATVNTAAVELYEVASRAAAEEVFADAPRWQKLVGCTPQADLSDSCVESFVRRVGKRAFRRELSDDEVTQWASVGRAAATLPGSSVEQGLASIVSGLLQSVYFLYRVETSKGDLASGRMKYDGESMATRLAFFLTGRPPSDELLAAAASGQLETAEGVRAAAAPLLRDPSAVPTMASFFLQLSQAELVSVVERSPDLYPTFDVTLKSSMVQAARLFIEEVVLAPGGDVRAFYDSSQTFVDATLAPYYGVPTPQSGFALVELGRESPRAGILGQPAVLAGHGTSDRTSPTRRGVFISTQLLCQPPDPPPDGVVNLPPQPPSGLTARQRMELVVSFDATCAECHQEFDPFGFALEHFDPIGRYRETEEGLTIDATGTLDGVQFDGEAELGAALGQNPRAIACLVQNLYRDANALHSAESDAAQVEALKRRIADVGYVWRDFVAELVASDAFRSHPVQSQQP